MRAYTIQKLGPRRAVTPEGYLLCEGVPVARTGEMLYAEGEVPVDVGRDGFIRISRDDQDLFSPTTMASCIGKPVTLDHPEEFVSPGNFGGLAMGSMFNVRRGDGIENDLMLADLLITHQDAIKAVQEDEIEEVSLGYEADYEQQEPGRGGQRNIVVNHVALVARGRCGPRCAIGDKEMAKKVKRSFSDRIRAAFMSKDADEVEKLAKEAEDSDGDDDEKDGSDKKTGDALNKILTRLSSMDADIQELKKAAAEDDDDDDDGDDGKANDAILSAETGGQLSMEGVKLYTGDSARLIAERAEILAPGTKLPTFDSKTTDAKRAVGLCKCQRKALDAAYQTDAGKAAITPFLGGHEADFAKLPLHVLQATFTGAAELLRQRNNDAATRGSVTTTTRDFGKSVSVAEINRANREFHANRSK